MKIYTDLYQTMATFVSESASICGPKASPWCFTRSLLGRSKPRPFLQKKVKNKNPAFIFCFRRFFVLVTNPVHPCLASFLRARLTLHHHPPNFGAVGTIYPCPLCLIFVCVACCYPPHFSPLHPDFVVFSCSAGTGRVRVPLSSGLLWCARLEQVPPQPTHQIAPYFCALTPLFSVYSGRFRVELFCVHFGLPRENAPKQVDIASLPSYLHLSSVPTMCCKHYLRLNSLYFSFVGLLDLVCTLSHFLFSSSTGL